jgi:5-methylcytosine-specific restriction endonuclease McrA
MRPAAGAVTRRAWCGEERVCVWCAGSFLATDPRQRYCRPACRYARYDAANPEKRREKERQRWERDGDKERARSRLYRERTPEAQRDRKRRHRAQNPAVARAWEHRRRARVLGLTVGSFTPDELAAKFAYWGGRCYICGGSWSEVEHVKPLAKGGAHMLANLRPVCGPCNKRKWIHWYGVAGLARLVVEVGR